MDDDQLPSLRHRRSRSATGTRTQTRALHALRPSDLPGLHDPGPGQPASRVRRDRPQGVPPRSWTPVPGRHQPVEGAAGRASSPFLVEVVRGGPQSLFQGPGDQVLFDMGAMYPPAVAIGQFWRLFTAMFLHANLLHLAFNAYALWLFGRAVEEEFGRANMVAIYFVTGFLASAASYALGPVQTLAVGASGAIFGIQGLRRLQLPAAPPGPRVREPALGRDAAAAERGARDREREDRLARPPRRLHRDPRGLRRRGIQARRPPGHRARARLRGPDRGWRGTRRVADERDPRAARARRGRASARRSPIA